jgi:hypothetical protein
MALLKHGGERGTGGVFGLPQRPDCMPVESTQRHSRLHSAGWQRLAQNADLDQVRCPASSVIIYTPKTHSLTSASRVSAHFATNGTGILQISK